jgi:mercuric ion transport protein
VATDKARLKESSISVITLFASAGTLICCALPILLVTLGMGAAVASLTSSAPWLVGLSRHKEWVFAFSFVLLLVSAWFIYRPGRSCPTDPELARRCAAIDKVNRGIYWGSVLVWMIGFFAAFLLWPLTDWLNG